VLGAGDDFELRNYVLSGLEIADVAAAAAVVQESSSSALLAGVAGLGAVAVSRRRRQASNKTRGAIARLRRGFAITFVRGTDPRPGAAWFPELRAGVARLCELVWAETTSRRPAAVSRSLGYPQSGPGSADEGADPREGRSRGGL